MKKKILSTKLRLFLSLFITLYAFGYTSNTNAYTLLQEGQTQKGTETFLKYKGRVIDKNTRKPLALANIAVNTTNISIVTNKEGKFSLKVPNTAASKTISVSFLGYKTLEILLKDLKKKNNIITLSTSITELSTVNINAPKDAKALVIAALKKKGDNYIGERTIMTAFYRETIKKGRKNASLTEAVVKVFKQPNKAARKDVVELVKSRKNTNYSRLDTLAVKLQGGPYSTLYSDIVKYPQYIFTEDTFPYYDFSFDTPSQINNRQVYVVKFKQQANVVTPFYLGKLYIDSETFSLVSAVYQLNVENKDEAVNLFVRKKPRQVKVEPITAEYRVDYKAKNGKWYYSYSNIQLVFRVKWRKKLFGSNYSLNIEMAITDWKENLGTKINSEKRIRPTAILSDETSGFSDPAFWGAYNIIEPEKSIESAIKKIAKQLSKIKPK